MIICENYSILFIIQYYSFVSLVPTEPRRHCGWTSEASGPVRGLAARDASLRLGVAEVSQEEVQDEGLPRAVRPHDGDNRDVLAPLLDELLLDDFEVFPHRDDLVFPHVEADNLNMNAL